jgi:hypothetical protein
MNIQEQIRVMQHFADGGKIESRCNLNKNNEAWVLCAHPVWNWNTFSYRIKKEPVVFYRNQFKDGSWGAVWLTKEQALEQTTPDGYFRKGVKFVEVEEDDEETI